MSSRSDGIGPDGKVYCKHNEEAAKRKANTPKHPNREFYCCKRSQADPSRCKFWFWADELFPSGTIVHASGSPPHSPPKEGTRAGGRPISTPYTRPSYKPSLSSTSPSEMVNLRNKKRLELIEAGLKQREVDFSPTRSPDPSREPGLSISESIAPIIPQPPSPVPTEVDSDEVEAPPRKTYSFLGLPSSPEPVVSAIKDEDRPPTPKKRRTISQPTPPGDGLLLTPPQSTRRSTEFDRPGSSIVTRSRKGKEREGAAVHTEGKDGFESEEPQGEDSLPLFTIPDDTSRISSVSPTPAENVLDYADGIKARVKVLSEYMDSFDITKAAKQLQTVERQKVQYEYRDQSQKKRIEELVAERDKLAAEVARLKESLRISEERLREVDGA